MTEAKKEPGAQFGVNLGERSSAFLGVLFEKFHFSFQQKKQLAEFASDFEAWDETPVYELLANEQCGLNFNAMGASVSDILSADTQSPIGAKIEKENHGDKADVNGIQGGVCEQADNTYGDTSETCRSERSQTGEIYYGEKAEAHYDKQIPSSHDGQNGKKARYGKQNDKI